MRRLPSGLLCLLALNAQANVIQYFAAGVSYSNPSDLFKIKKGEFIIGSTGAYADLQFTGSALNFNSFQYESGTNSSREYMVLPYGRIAKRINEKAVFALDITEPYNSKLDWGSDSFTRYANTQNLMTDIDVSPRVSYDLSPRLHVGGGLNFNFITHNEVNFAFPTGPTSSSNLINNSTSFGLGFNLGATYIINETNFLGILYYSPIKQNTHGDSRLAANYNANYAVSLTLPSTTSISYVHLFNPEWLVNLKVFQTGWNSLQIVTMYNTAAPAPMSDFTFQMNYKNSYAYQATVRNQYTKKLGVAVHGMIDNAPAQNDLRSLPFPADTQYLIGVSGDYHFSENTSVELFYGHVFSYPSIQNQVMTDNGPIPFTTGKMNINGNIIDLKLKIEA